ncbi:transmembrane protein 183 isoform X2 [Pseudomyrmex gracilis]|uniref:transmembrane protein 183 isoform X2 n=1 Tax=Pseudomyrmex gracilis TaxID=219809 RepID=UPI000994ACB8|nr:transmembrane protein 183 isoform X2 [Pseudomyrmex gracilis]
MLSTSRKKAGRRSAVQRENDIIGDVTIDDFANTLKIRARLKKSVTNISNKVKQKASTEEENSVWDEEGEKRLVQCTKGSNHKNMSFNRKKDRRKLEDSQEDSDKEGNIYPLDIWFVISEYIQPEAVGKFARICRSSYYVTTTGKFWFCLYKSYYKFVPNLPQRLQPQCLILHGLRACVIRALHYGYFSCLRQPSIFIQDIVCLDLKEEPYSLVKRKCTLMWHKEKRDKWYFYFKFKDISETPKKLLKQNKQYDLENDDENFNCLQMPEDVTFNPDEKCKVLEVICLYYSMVPPVIGLVLQTVSVTLQPGGYREHKFQLGFGSSFVRSTFTHQVILRHVTNYRILNWWNPAYPHEDGSYFIELPQDDLSD